MHEFKNIKNILVVKLRHIGDVLLTAPVFRALRENFPDARICGLVGAGTEDVLTGNPNINEIITLKRDMKGAGFIDRLSYELSFIKSLRSKKFDMAIDLTSGDRPAIISFISGARYRLAYDPGKSGFMGKRLLYTHMAKMKDNQHIVLSNMDLLKSFDIGSDNLRVDFNIPAEADASVDDLFKTRGIEPGDKIIHVHPTSRWLFKCWEDSQMARVIQWMSGRGIKVIITSSPDKRELDRTRSILSKIDPKAIHNIVDLAGKTNISQLGAISKLSNLFFGVDSAPMHIAAAVGTPVIALFGPSGAFNWGPWDNDAKPSDSPYPLRNGIQSCGKHIAIQRAWDCIPCGRDGCEGSKISKCLYDIKSEEVIDLLAKKGF